MSPEQLLGELESEGDILVCDLEAGVGTLLRLQPGSADVVLVVVNPTVKSIEGGRRAVEIASERAPVIVIANRIRDGDDFRSIAQAFPSQEIVMVPEDESISHADEEGIAPIDANPGGPGVSAIAALAAQLADESSKR